MNEKKELIDEEIEYKPIEIYYYERKTREYLGSAIAKADIEESRIRGKFVPLLSAFSTLIKPPEYSENQIPVYHSHIEEQTVTTQEPVYDETGEITGYEEKNETVKVLIEDWTVEKDLRKNFFKVDEKLNVNDITEIGEVEALIVSKELGGKIKETPENYKISEGKIIEKSQEEINLEKEQKERERIGMLTLTAADVERAIYQAKGMDFDDIVEFVKLNPPEGLDIKALKIELKANNFYRANPYVEQIGTLLGYTSEDLDTLFLTKSLPEKEELPVEDEESELENKEDVATPEKSSDVDNKTELEKE